MNDIEAACSLIKRMRARDKKNKGKTVTIRLFKENNYVISACLSCKYMPNGNTSYGHYLNHCGHIIAPTTNNKLRCINEAGMMQLKKHRIISNKWNVNLKENIYFCESIGKNIEIIEQLHYSIRTGKVSYNSKFQSKLNLIRIDIK